MGTFGTVVAIAIGISAISAVVLVPLRWRAFGLPQAREELIVVRGLLQDAKPLTSPEAKAADQALADLVRDLRHRRVRVAIGRVLDHYRRAFASEPGPSFWVIGGEPTPEEVQRTKMAKIHQEQVDATVAAIEDALRAIRDAQRFTQLHTT